MPSNKGINSPVFHRHRCYFVNTRNKRCAFSQILEKKKERTKFFSTASIAILNLRFIVLQPIGYLASFQLNFSQQAPVSHLAQGGILGQLELLFDSPHIQ
jgi:hypothetical protein